MNDEEKLNNVLTPKYNGDRCCFTCKYKGYEDYCSNCHGNYSLYEKDEKGGAEAKDGQ